ncbi:MAG TPA: amylo-alpha-1,6-glucosidase [Ktedonobacteraceae bacterium]|nr:amylo-alpha-1,6-glucosidase [Ktedonobacteraceae bacterium]
MNNTEQPGGDKPQPLQRNDLAGGASAMNLAPTGEVLHHLWQEAMTALQSLQSPLGISASGMDDHFHAIFGRDSLWTVLFALEAARLLQDAVKQGAIGSLRKNRLPTDIVVPEYMNWLHNLAATVLRSLARLQGTVINDVNEEQPGRIIHEYWVPVPERHTLAGWPLIDGRYYGSFDSAFLYLVTLHAVDRLFDDAALLDELWPSAQAIVRWMLDWSDLDGDGLVEYKKRNPRGIGLDNEVWKDSGESIQMPDHRPVKHPVAWIEVQGYAWAAYHAYLALASKHDDLASGDEAQTGAIGSLFRRVEIEQRLDRLKQGINSFWFEDGSSLFPAMALDGDKQPVRVVSTNPGHLLWSGCLAQDDAQRICERLMQPDMMTPWGLRTLSTTAYYYDPLAYHNGTIWPFDNCVVALGLSRYGFQQEAIRLTQSVLQALYAFKRPVELYTVQPSYWVRSHHLAGDWFLADYHRSCNVQAWTAAATLYFAAFLLLA